MVRLFFRFVGLLLLAGAFAALVVDGTRSVAAGTPAILPLGRTASSLFPNVLVALHRAMEAHSPVLWDPIAVSILLLPAWLVLGVVGLVLLAVTRRRVAKIGYERR
jgi:hypothetical protein